jgi:hypothetical protein
LPERARHQSIVIEKYQPSDDQLERLDDATYEAYLAITLAMLRDVERANDISDIEGMTPNEIEAWIEQQRALIEPQIDGAVDDLQNGGTLADFERNVAEITTAAILIVLLFAVGGVDNLRNKPRARAFIRQVQSTIRGNSAAIRGTASRIATGGLTDKQLRAQARRRSLIAKQAYERQRILDEMTTQGHNEGRRFIGSNHPCPDCPRHQRLNWVPIEEIVPIATACVCGGRCLCRIETRFNPVRAVQQIGNGSLLDRVNRFEENLANTENEFLGRHGWLD